MIGGISWRVYRRPARPRRMRATNQQALITAVFEAAERATDSITHLVPDLDRDRAEYALVSVLLEEAWVAQR